MALSENLWPVEVLRSNDQFTLLLPRISLPKPGKNVQVPAKLWLSFVLSRTSCTRGLSHALCGRCDLRRGTAPENSFRWVFLRCPVVARPGVGRDGAQNGRSGGAVGCQCGFVRKLGDLPSISGISGPWALGKMTINDDSPMDFEGPPCSNKPAKTEGTQGGSYWDDLEILFDVR